MSRDKRYQHMLNAKRWSQVKAIVWNRANGLCEECLANGIVTPGVDCHHIAPVEHGRTAQEMADLCYNPANIRLLCVACHIKVHQQMRSHTKEQVEANKERRRSRFMERNDPNFDPENPRGVI